MHLLIISGRQFIGRTTPSHLPPETRAFNESGLTPEREAATLAAGD
jgi:hypothetical protein